MKTAGFHYEVKARLLATEEELDYMIDCSENHYDWKCQDASAVAGKKMKKAGVAADHNGFLTIWRSQIKFYKDEKIEGDHAYELSSYNLDLLCKIIENGENQALYYELRQILRDTSDKWCEANGTPKPNRSPILHPIIESMLCEKQPQRDVNLDTGDRGRKLPEEKK